MGSDTVTHLHTVARTTHSCYAAPLYSDDDARKAEGGHYHGDEDPRKKDTHYVGYVYFVSTRVYHASYLTVVLISIIYFIRVHEIIYQVPW